LQRILCSVNSESQKDAALFAGFVAGLLHSRRQVNGIGHQNSEQLTNGTLRRVFSILENDPLITGQELAQLIRVSPGYLSRSFKQEVGISLVEYRNRLRLQRFCDIIGRGESNLLSAALKAGFGSYAQFHRIYRQLLGGSPRDYIKRFGAGQTVDLSMPTGSKEALPSPRSHLRWSHLSSGQTNADKLHRLASGSSHPTEEDP
jgi:AraC-like DNA-binding protein